MVDKKKLFDATTLLLEAIEGKRGRVGTERTPERVARDWPEMFDGYDKEATDVLDKFFDTDGYDEMVIREEIKVESFCEHHLLPFRGKAWVGYIPNERIVGLDKIDKLVRLFSHRLQTQERLTFQIAETLMKVLKPQGVMVVLKCYHDCMRLRGVRSEKGLTTTSACFGIFRDDPTVKEEFLDLVNV